MSKGAQQDVIVNTVFGNHSLEYLHNLGKGLLSIVQK